MNAIVLDAVSKTFAAQTVLQSLDLTIEPGEFLVIVGRSGSGKSTLLRILAGLEQPSAGTVQSVEDIAFAFQEPRLLPWLSVAENVTFGLPGRDHTQIARTALHEVQLDHKEKAWPLTLSGGQAQRVSLARALVHQPSLLLLDEPFGALDALTRLEMQNLVAQLWKKHGLTVVMVTHDVEEAVRLGDRILVLGDGSVLDQVSPRGSGPRNPATPENASLTAKLLKVLGVSTDLSPL